MPRAESCKSSCSPVAKIRGQAGVGAKSEQALLSAIAGRPVSVAIEADQTAFQHAVLAVGYSTEAGT